jgi:hypothetical protein
VRAAVAVAGRPMAAAGDAAAINLAHRRNTTTSAPFTLIMSTELLGLIIAAIGCILFIAVGVGIPSLAVIALKFFKYKERELALEMEYRHRSEQNQEKQVAVEQRVQVLEDTVTRLDHDVREKLGIPAVPAHPELYEASGAPEDASPLPAARDRVR